MNIIRDKGAPAQPTTLFQLQKRDTTATGVERIAVREPAGNDRHEAWKVMADRIAANPATYGPWSDARLVLKGADR